jgi:hypothetical protein
VTDSVNELPAIRISSAEYRQPIGGEVTIVIPGSSGLSYALAYRLAGTLCELIERDRQHWEGSANPSTIDPEGVRVQRQRQGFCISVTVVVPGRAVRGLYVERAYTACATLASGTHRVIYGSCE